MCQSITPAKLKTKQLAARSPSAEDAVLEALECAASSALWPAAAWRRDLAKINCLQDDCSERMPATSRQRAKAPTTGPGAAAALGGAAATQNFSRSFW